MFTLRLAQIRLAGDEDANCEKLFEMLLASTALTETKNVSPQLLGGKLSKTQLAELETLVESEEFNNILENMDS